MFSMLNGKAELIKMVGKEDAERYLQIIKTIMKYEAEKQSQVVGKA